VLRNLSKISDDSFELTAKVKNLETNSVFLSSSKMGTLNEVYAQMDEQNDDVVAKLLVPYLIGGNGPGGGTIWYAENGVYMEYWVLEDSDWNSAADSVKKFNEGSKFKDWYWPAKDALDQVYKQHKKKPLHGIMPGIYWSSTSGLNVDRNEAWNQNFKDGKQDTGGYKFDVHHLLIIREFTH
jgi:hypothetical protein